MSTERKTLCVVLLTTLTGWIGFSLPFPIFSHIFLDPAHGIVTADMSTVTRTMLLGSAMALYPLGQMIGAPFLGRLSDKYGRKPVLVACLWLTTLGALILAFGVAAGSIALILIGRLFTGIAEGSLAIVQSIASDISSPRTKARNFAYIGIAIDVGFIIGPIAGGLLSDSALHPMFNVALPFWCGAAVFGANAIMVMAFLSPAGQAEKQTAPARSLRAALTDRSLVPVFALTFATFWAIMIFFDFSAVYFVQVFDTQPALLGVLTALISAPLIASGLVAGKVDEKIGPVKMAYLSLGLLAGGTALFLIPDSLIGLALPVCIICVGINFGQTATSVIASDRAGPGEQGQVMGLYRSITVAAAAISAIIGGLLAGFTPQGPFLTAILAAGLGFLVLNALQSTPAPVTEDA
ncbi:MFS transporter [Labrenzia sp. PHM005]|uniref:MFS transporter n=1 Tax=Labrenzia sp. PHM005 TaxID=2590016 RepID=UPI00114045B6|nr:MFS transporter [Labrenzia sp. PHM005]QDG75228.1 MFS transporter [Labrenzia sp. PHM005]